jgi:hypothetical protein
METGNLIGWVSVVFGMGVGRRKRASLTQPLRKRHDSLSIRNEKMAGELQVPTGNN